MRTDGDCKSIRVQLRIATATARVGQAGASRDGARVHSLGFDRLYFPPGACLDR
jgi:hypothetical protein